MTLEKDELLKIEYLLDVHDKTEEYLKKLKGIRQLEKDLVQLQRERVDFEKENPDIIKFLKEKAEKVKVV